MTVPAGLVHGSARTESAGRFQQQRLVLWRQGLRRLWRRRPWSSLLVFLLSLGLRAGWAAGGEIADPDHAPYHLALIAYKEGKLEEARHQIDLADRSDSSVAILRARIVAEQGEANAAEKILLGLNPGDNSALREEITLALGDVMLAGAHFDRAWVYYRRLLATHPDDPDLILNILYTRAATGDLPTAAKELAALKPLDPTHPNYYFGKAAIAQVTNNPPDADAAIETARTIYGSILVDQYLRRYLKLFSGKAAFLPASLMTPARATPAPTSPAPPRESSEPAARP